MAKFILFLLFFTHIPQSFCSTAKGALFLQVGEQRALYLPGIKRYSLGSPAARSIAVPGQKDRILLKGVQAGQTDLWVWKQNGESEFRTIHVLPATAHTLSPTLLHSISALNFVEIFINGSKLILKGTLTQKQQVSLISSLLSEFPEQISPQIELDLTLLDDYKSQLKKWLEQSSYAEALRVEQNDSSLWLRGTLKNQSDRNNALQSAKKIFPLLSTDISSMPDDAPTVFFRVFLLEIKKDAFNSFGVQWPSSQGALFQVSPIHFKHPTDLDLTLQALSTDRSARVLSQPQMAVRAPGEAELFAGGELPIRVVSRQKSYVVWRPYGLTLKLKINQTAGETIRLDIHTEVSHLDSDIGMDNIPGIRANKMKTQIDASFGTPLFLCGLLHEGTRKQVKGIPLLKDIPILGSLFGSQDYMNEQSELVAILLPHSAPPPAPTQVLGDDYPRGKVPVPRNWLTLEEEKEIRSHPHYPWNALQ